MSADLAQVLRVAYASAGQGVDVGAGQKMPDLFEHLAAAVRQFQHAKDGLPSCGFDIEAHAAAYNEGFQEAVAQGLADDPSLAGDWLATQKEQVRIEEREAWIQRLAALCDDDWLRRRDRCMNLPGASTRHDRTPAGAWESAARVLREVLFEHGYDEADGDRHASYRAWMTGGRDRGDAS